MNIEPRRKELKDALSWAQKHREVVDDLIKSLEKQLAELEREAGIRLILEKWSTMNQLDVPAGERPAEAEPAIDGKPNVQVYKEILLDAGRALHASDIATEAERRGVVFKNPHKRPVGLVSDAMSHCQDFDNLGGNTWWVAGAKAPGIVKWGEDP